MKKAAGGISDKMAQWDIGRFLSSLSIGSFAVECFTHMLNKRVELFFDAGLLPFKWTKVSYGNKSFEFRVSLYLI